MAQIQELEQAIAALESQRGVLGDEVVDLALSSLREKLTSLQSSSRPPEQQRKLLTVLFADIVGSTQVGKDRDPEQTLEIMDGALRALAEPIARHRGRVTRFMGDGFIALFGLPLAYEDDAERAVRAGLDILQVARQTSANLQEKFQISAFDVRVGVNSGLVASGGFSEAEDTVMGSTVNLAQRLESAAPPGGLLISQPTWRLVEGLFQVLPVEPVVAKGFEQPVPAYLVRGVVQRAFSPSGARSEGFEYQMVGRDAELQALQDGYHFVVQESRCAVVALVGDPGMGKKRLQYELIAWIRGEDEQVITFQGRAQPVNNHTPYSLLKDLFSNRFDILDGDPVEVVRQKIETGFGDFLATEAQMKAHLIAALLGFELGTTPFLAGVQADANQLRQRGLHYLQEYLETILRRGPVVISLEDVHAADIPSLEAMGWLTSRLVGLPLFVLGIARPSIGEQLARFEKEHTQSGVVYKRLDLLPLSSEASRQLVQTILRLDQIPLKLGEVVASASAGNPYYIAELLKMLIEDGVITLSQQAGECQVDWLRLGRLRVPATLTALIQARLDSLPDEERLLLQRASVVGEVFWEGSLQSLEINPAVAGATLDTLKDRGLVTIHPDSQFDTMQEYAFASGILREVVYETVLMRNRQSFHGQVGDWLVSATQRAGRQAEYAAIIARHYDLAGQDSQAAHWYLSAGEMSKRQGASHEARRFFDLALERLAPHDLEHRWQVLCQRSEVLGILGDYPARTADDAALLALAQELQDDNRLAEAYYHKGSFATTTGDDRQAVIEFEHSLQAARRAGDCDLQANLLSMQAISLLRLGQHGAAQAAAEQALIQAEQVTDEVTRARAYTNLAAYFSEAGDAGRGIDLFEELVEITRRLDERLGLAINLSNLGYNQLRLGLYAAGLRNLQESLHISQGIGARHLDAFTRLNYGLACLLTGGHAQACQELERAIGELEATQDQFGQAAGYHYLGRACEAAGETARAERHFALALALFEKGGYPEYACDARAGLARCYLDLGRTPEAEACARLLWAALHENGGEGLEFPILAFHTCAQVFLARGDRPAVKEVVYHGYQELMERASRIKDSNWRKTYLESVAENRSLIERWQVYAKEE